MTEFAPTISQLLPKVADKIDSVLAKLGHPEDDGSVTLSMSRVIVARLADGSRFYQEDRTLASLTIAPDGRTDSPTSTRALQGILQQLDELERAEKSS